MRIQTIVKKVITPSLSLGLVGLLFACGNKTEVAGSQAPLVKAVRVDGNGSSALELRGSVASEGRLRLGFKLSGVIGSILVREGDRVRAGQVLAVLDAVDASTQLQSAKAALDRAKRDADRAERLAAEGIIPANQREDARNQWEACEAQWRQAQDGLSRTRLVAPVSGTVFQRLAEPGETVGAGSPVLMVDTTDRLVIKVGVTEREIARLKVDQEVQLIPEDGTRPMKGRVRSLAPSPGSSDGLYAMEILPEESKVLRSGALLTIRIEAQGDKGRMQIPFQALVHRQGQDFVFVIQRKGESDTVEARSVEVEEADGIGVILRKGIQAGERIAAEGAFFLENGQAVRTLE